MSSIGALLAAAALPDSPSPRLDAELLLARALGKPRSYLMTWPEREPTPEQVALFEKLLARRRDGEPVAYLLERQGFWNLDLEVGAATLIPRPDTERLVEIALAFGPAGPCNVLDLGTGSGAVALALASERPDWSVLGCDLIADAVALAERNRQSLGLTNVRFLQSNWFEQVPHAERYGLIVSNPPYIAEQDPHLRQGDVRFEPSTALVSGVDGLDAIRTLVKQAPGHLAIQGWLLIEHGWEQGATVRDLLSARGFSAVESWADLGGNERVSGGQWHA